MSKKDKLKDIKFLKDFNKITVSKACEEERINRSNLYSMKTSSDNIKRIKNNIDNKIKDLYKDYGNDSL